MENLDIVQVSADVGPQGVSLYFGLGDGTLAAERTFATRSITGTPSLAATADFNNDGNIDVATSDGSMLLGNGNDTFQAPVYGFDAPAKVISISPTDFNVDGNPDLLVLASDQEYVYLGNGDGTFQAPLTYSAGSGSAVVLAADFNGDRIPDLAVADTCINPSCTEPGIAILLGVGNGTFESPTYFSLAFVPQFMVVGDVNNDGILDLVVAGSDSTSGYIGILLGNGDGTFQTPIDMVFAQNFPFGLTISDFNGDGIQDLAFTSSSGLNVLLGTGDGMFGSPIVTPNVYAGSVRPSDFNGDGIEDLVVRGSGMLGLQILTGIGDGTFLTPLPLLQFNTVTDVKVARFGSHLLPDMLVLSDAVYQRPVGIVVNGTKE